MTIVPQGAPVNGSPEWVELEPARAPHYLLHALRTPSWRAGLPPTGGQTRPRTSADAILDSRVPWPGDELAERVSELSRVLFGQSAQIRALLRELQSAVDRLATGELERDELARVVDEAWRQIGYSAITGESECDSVPSASSD